MSIHDLLSAVVDELEDEHLARLARCVSEDLEGIAAGLSPALPDRQRFSEGAARLLSSVGDSLDARDATDIEYSHIMTAFLHVLLKGLTPEDQRDVIRACKERLPVTIDVLH